MFVWSSHSLQHSLTLASLGSITMYLLLAVPNIHLDFIVPGLTVNDILGFVSLGVLVTHLLLWNALIDGPWALSSVSRIGYLLVFIAPQSFFFNFT